MQKSESLLTVALAELNVEYLIKEIHTEEQELVNFLFTLGCFPGEKITVLSKLSSNFVITIKDARYSIDTELADSIAIEAIV